MFVYIANSKQRIDKKLIEGTVHVYRLRETLLLKAVLIHRTVFDIETNLSAICNLNLCSAPR